MSETIEEAKTIENENLNNENENEVKQLYRDLLNRWLISQTTAWIEQIVVNNPEWRVFGNYHVYKGNSLDGGKCLIMLNILEEVNYSKVLHSFENLWEIMKYYESFGHRYEGYQYILVRSREKAKNILKLMEEKTKLSNVFQNQRVRNTILCLENGELIHIRSNYQIGRREPSPYDPGIRLDLTEE